MKADPIRIRLELEPPPEPIHGSLQVHDEAPQRFWGWLQLSALLLAAAPGCAEQSTSNGAAE